MEANTPVDAPASAPRIIDGLLRGAYTGREQLRSGRLDLPIKVLVVSGLALGATYGTFMGTFSVLNRGGEGVWQMIGSAAKVPLLFFLTLCVTFPSLYVFSALARSGLRVRETLKLLCAAMTVNLAVLASFGPVVAFFALSTPSYAFMVVLNVIFFTASGFIGLVFIRHALESLFGGDGSGGGAAGPEPIAFGPEAEASTPVRRPSDGPTLARTVFSVWLVIFSIVGAQMGWILRPFIGAPGLEFTLFRAQEDNFFIGLARALQLMFQ